MEVELDDMPAARAERLEHAIAELKTAIEGGHVRPVRRHQPTVDPGGTGQHQVGIIAPLPFAPVGAGTATSPAPVGEAADRPSIFVSADRTERPTRLGHRLVPLGGRVAAPRDATTNMQREPRTV